MTDLLSRSRRWGWGARAALAVTALLLVLAAIGAPARVAAHAYLERSEPEANSVTPEAPAEVRLWFTEPLERDFSRAELFDANGDQVPTEGSFVDADPFQMVLPLPDDLPNGTYTVQWRNISAADGHPQSGYLPFTIGSQADVVVPEPPRVTVFNEPPLLLGALGRWLSLLGVTGVVGAFVAWLFVIRTARDPLEFDLQDRVQERVAMLMLASIGMALLGSVIALIYQTMSAGTGFSFGTLWNVLEGTRYGHLWALRVVILLGLIALITSDSLWDDPPRTPWAGLMLMLSGALLLPFSLNSHAAAQPVGRAAAIAVDWLHLAASSVWVGGLLALLVALIYGARSAAREDRREMYALAIPSFTTIAIISIAVLILSGIYSAWLQVGNLIALRETSYGQVLLIKIALTIPMLALGAYNQRFLGPRMREAARSGVHFGRTIAAEAMLGIGVLFAVGLLTTLPTARDVITQEAVRSTFHFTDDVVHASLYISPGAVGYNEYIVDVGLAQGELPAETEVLLRFQNAGQLQGVREVRLVPAFGTRYEGSGSELSVVGNWQTELIVRRPGTTDARFNTPLEVPRVPPEERIPGEPPRFAGLTGMAAMLFLAIGVFGIVSSVRSRAVWQDRAIGSGIACALILAGGLILAVNRVEPTQTALASNPVPRTAESVALGHELFVENCSVCHGPDAEGDGPLAATLVRPPANLHEQHVEVHTDGDLYWWIQNGIPPAMPGFSDQLDNEEIWHIVNYIRNLRDPVAGTE
jgi:copper transport protein